MYINTKLSLTTGAATGTFAFNGHLISVVHPGTSPAALSFAIGWWLMAVATIFFTIMAFTQLVRRNALRP